MANNDDFLVSKAKKLWNSSRDFERVVECLRTGGMSKLDSIKAVRNACCVTLGEAKKIVNGSKVWRDTRSSTIRVHKALDRALDTAKRS